MKAQAEAHSSNFGKQPVGTEWFTCTFCLSVVTSKVCAVWGLQKCRCSSTCTVLGSTRPAVRHIVMHKASKAIIRSRQGMWGLAFGAGMVLTACLLVREQELMLSLLTRHAASETWRCTCGSAVSGSKGSPLPEDPAVAYISSSSEDWAAICSTMCDRRKLVLLWQLDLQNSMLYSVTCTCKKAFKLSASLKADSGSMCC